MLIAVCVCTAARGAFLARLLRALGTVDIAALAPHDVRLIVVDNRPGTGAAAVVERARAALPMPVDLLEEPVPGIASARNRSIAAALDRGADLVAIVDDDDQPEPDWLLQLVRVQAATGADIVYGGARHPPDAPIPRWLRRLEQFRPHRLDAIGKDGLPRGATTCNALLSGRLLRHFAAEGEVFRTRLRSGEDIDLFQRARRAGFTDAVALASQVVLGWHPSRYTLRGLLYHRFDRGIARVHRRLAQGDAQAPVRAEVLRRLGRGVRKLPRRATNRDAAVTQLMRVAEHVGEVMASFGYQTPYYGKMEDEARRR